MKSAVSVVRSVVERSYAKGLYQEQNLEAVKEGFHDSFRMWVQKDNDTIEINKERWLGICQQLIEKDASPQENSYEFRVVDVTGNAALVVLEQYKADKHIYTDYLSLYKFNDGWKIVGKIFYMHK